MKTDRIRSLSKEKGLSLSFICRKLGVAPVYFIDIDKSGRDIPSDKLNEIADILDTTPEYLKGETDVKEKTPAEADVTFDDFTYALHGETKELTEENKQKLLEMARFFKMQQDKEKK